MEELQHLLVENGILDRHMIDRDFGWFTEQAVKEAEKAAGMERLTELGFKIGTADGSFGRRTQQAIEVIQGIYELPRDGIVWPGIWQMLFPDDDLRFERENDGPVRIDGVYLPNWDRVISDSGSETDHKDGKLVTEKKTL